MVKIRTIIVTGGIRGIGRACVDHLARNGAQVVFTGRDRDAGRQIEHSVAVNGTVVTVDGGESAGLRTPRP